jgi:hypothetical protein
MSRYIIVLIFTFLFSQTNNGKLYDPGRAMTAAADNAPKLIKSNINWIGNFSVQFKTKTGDQWTEENGYAEVTLFNRGAGFMERLVLNGKSSEGLQHEQMMLINYSDGRQIWNLGIVDNIKENVVIFDGQLKNNTLELYQGIRRGGGAKLSILRLKRYWKNDQSMKMTIEESQDYMNTYELIEERTYTRTSSKHASLNVREDIGQAFLKRPKEAGQFDFLLGEGNATHEMTFPNGQQAKWPASTTAVHVLGGAAIMEFNWYDVDPRNPNQATTIIRIFNRAMNRWENLFASNRSNTLLYFGGVKQGKDIVLTIYDTHSSTPQYSFFTFHTINDKGYDWYSLLTRDRGATTFKNWTIQVRKK